MRGTVDGDVDRYRREGSISPIGRDFHVHSGKEGPTQRPRKIFEKMVDLKRIWYKIEISRCCCCGGCQYCNNILS